LVNKQVKLWLQQGAVSFGSIAGLVSSANIVLNVPLTVGANNTNTEFDGAIIGSTGFTKTGTGTLTLSADEGYSGSTTVSGGNLLVSGSLSSASPVTVATGATLSGPGIVGGTTTVNGTLAPGNGVGVLTTGKLTFNASGTLAINVIGPTAGTNYSRVVATGPVNVTGATLSLTIASGFTPSANTPFDILVNQSGTPVTGTFAGLPEGAVTSANGQFFAITYHGGTGNDIVLTPSTPPVPANLVVTAGSGTIGLSWDSVGGTATYNVYRGTSPGGEAATPIATGLANPNYTDSTLAFGTTYYYRVTETTAGVESQPSNEASALADGPTITALQVSPNPATTNQTVTLTATVTSNGGTPQTGGVRFFDNGVSLGTVQVDSTGTAVLQTTFALGAHSLTATYRGSVGFDVSTTAQAVNEVVGPPTVGSVQINDGSVQRSEVRSITVTFTEPVTFAGSGTVNQNAAAAFQLQHVQDATNVTLSAIVSTDSQNRTIVTLTFSGSETDPVSVLNNGVASLADGRYALTILSAKVTGANGLALDGDSDGIAGGDYVSPPDVQGGGPGQLQLYRLFGDATGDGLVDPQDLGQFRTTYNASVGGSAYLAYLDSDNSGVVGPEDLGQFRSHFNATVF
jgi:autotransporter-associated beta strand protein